MLLWYTLSLNGMLKASRRFGYVTSTGLGFPFFQVPSFSWRSIRSKFSSLFKPNDFTDGFQATPFLHFIIESYKLSKSVILFIFCVLQFLSADRLLSKSRTVSFDCPQYCFGFMPGISAPCLSLPGNHYYVMTMAPYARQSGHTYSSSMRSCC